MTPDRPGTQGSSAQGSSAQGSSAPDMSGRRLPPVAELCVASMVLVITGGIWMAAHMPARPPLAPAVGLLGASGALVLVNAVLLLRLRDFAWKSFTLVARWAFLAYVVIAGMLEYIFVLDGTRGASLLVMTFMLVVFALDVPALLAFSVARYQNPLREPSA